jgi:pilus assembly protein CpaC
MRSKSAIIVLVLMCSLALATASTLVAGTGRPSTEGAQPPQVQQTPMPAPGSEESLRLFEGKSLVINTPESLKRVSITNEQVATAVVISPNQVLIHGIKPGTVTLLLWNEREQVRVFDLQILQGRVDLDVLKANLGKYLPGESIEVHQSGSSVVLTGTVSSTALAEQAANVAKTEAPNVVNLLNVPAKKEQVVLLQVKFAEVDRNAIQQLGVNILSTGALNTPGLITTGQFSTPIVNAGKQQTTFSVSDALNIFLFRPDLNLGLTIKALQQQSLLQILAEPNLLALTGKEASFLAGGEVPIPVVQGSTGTPVVSIQFKEFGVRLKFRADPNPDGMISLKVTPEVSSVDFTNAVTLSGFLIPAFTTRRAETEVQLKDGQSFAIAGLMDNRVTKVANKIPWLGDVPLLGKLFQSSEFKKSNSELLVMVTPKMVQPLEPGQAAPMPAFPVPFLDGQKFDGKVGEAAPGPGGSKRP